MANKHELKVGDSILAKVSNGQIVEAKIRAITDGTKGKTFIIDFGHEQVATINERDIVHEV